MTVQKSIEFNEDVLKLNVLEDSGNYLIHRDILRQQISQKQGTVSTKTRSEVRRGGKKPWQQKGTGRARAGSSRSPLWRGGGVIFGPKITPPPFHKGERLEPALARPVPFCFQGLRPPPLTSLLVFVETVPCFIEI